MRVCSHCGGRGRIPNFEMELIDPSKGLVEGNVKLNENGTQPCYSCEGTGVITAPRFTDNIFDPNTIIGARI